MIIPVCFKLKLVMYYSALLDISRSSGSKELTKDGRL